MQLTSKLSSEVAKYQFITGELQTRYADIDDETLRDTLEGISDLPDMIKEVVRSSLDDDMIIGALKLRIGDMQDRLERIKHRLEKKREIVCWAMGEAQLDRLTAEDFSVSLRQGPPRLDIVDETQIPTDFLVPVAPRIDRAGLLIRLKQGECISGAALVEGQPHISVRVK
jgi:Gp157 protein